MTKGVRESGLGKEAAIEQTFEQTSRMASEIATGEEDVLAIAQFFGPLPTLCQTPASRLPTKWGDRSPENQSGKPI